MCSIMKLVCGSALVLVSLIALPEGNAAPPKIKSNLGQVQLNQNLNPGNFTPIFPLGSDRRNTHPGGDQRQQPSTSNTRPQTGPSSKARP